MIRMVCECGTPIRVPLDELGCVECGRLCCPACAVDLESTAYCARCAASLLDVPGDPADR
jgi:uncharacterized paraquat-inducible protein A